MLHPETRVRARVIQLLYAADLQPDVAVADLAHRLLGLSGGVVIPDAERAEALAARVAQQARTLDAEIADRIDGWQWDRVGIVERNILRLALYELQEGHTPPKVVIDEALRLAHWFAGDRAHILINGVLDALAKHHRYL